VRLDKFLKVSRLVKRRTLAKELCDGGRVAVNGRTAKAGTEVSPGDRLAVSYGTRTVEVRILAVPAGNVSAAQAASLIEALGAEAPGAGAGGAGFPTAPPSP
jgi:ribosomal 50S subunit-recycling heat shock protein